MPWKMKADKSLDIDAAGNPVWIGDDGKEAPINGGDVLGTITRLNGEAAANRKAKEKAESDLTKFANIDPDKAREALDKLALIDQNKLIDAGKVEEVKAQIKQSFQTQIEQANKQNAELLAGLKEEKLTNAFNNSEFVKNNLIIPPDIARVYFGNNLDIDGDRIIAKDANGNAILSKKKAGEVAGFDELIQDFVEQYPHKTAILKGGNHNGTGSGGGGGADGRKRTVTRAEEAKMTITDRQALMKDIKEGKAELVKE